MKILMIIFREIQEKQSLYLRDSYQTSFSKRRRVRNRKKLRIEKILNAPEVTTPNQDCSMTSEDNSSVSSESEVEGIALDCPQEDKMPMTCVDKESERKTEFTITVKDKANAKQCTNQVSSVAPSNKQQNVFVSRTKEIQVRCILYVGAMSQSLYRLVVLNYLFYQRSML